MVTGRREQPFDWLHDAAVPAVWGATEATWVSLLVAAAADSGPGAHPWLGYPLFVVPVVVAALTARLIGRLEWTPWRRWLLQAAVALAGLALTAGVVTAVSVPGALWRGGLAPWTTSGLAARAAAAGWWVAVLTWVRGVWLGSRPSGFAHLVRSVAVGAGAFVFILIGRSVQAERAFASATRPAGLLLVLFVCGAATTVALVRERDLEREILDRPSPGASLSWLAVLAVPVAALVLLAVLVADVAGPVAPAVGRAIAAAAGWVWSGIVAVADAIAGLFPSHRAPPRPVARPVPQPPTHRLHVPTGPLAWIALIALAVGVVSLLWSARRLRPSIAPFLRLPRWKPPAGPGAPGQRVTWGRPHPMRAFRAMLHRALARLRGERVTGTGPVPAGAAPERPPVRREYRDVLVAAAGRGAGRRASETAHELEGRLSGLVGEASGDLARLTSLYGEVRYGGRQPGDEEGEAAATAAAAVIAGLAAPREVSTAPE